MIVDIPSKKATARNAPHYAICTVGISPPMQTSRGDEKIGEDSDWALETDGGLPVSCVVSVLS